MSDLNKTKTDPLQQLWDVLDDVHAGMLGVINSGQHLQPMAPQVEKETNSIWFYTSKDSDLVSAVNSDSRAQFCVTGKNHDYHACLSGNIVENPSRAHIDRFWSPIVAAWFKGGKDDPSLTMLELRLDDAAIWASTGSSLRFGWEMIKANLTDSTPDVGVRTNLSLPQKTDSAA